MNRKSKKWAGDDFAEVRGSRFAIHLLNNTSIGEIALLLIHLLLSTDVINNTSIEIALIFN